MIAGSGFLNRWSQVRLLPGVPNDSTQLDEAASEGVEQSWSKARELVELFLRACAVGAPCDDLAAALAESVLEDELVRLALDVVEGGEYRFARATELASAVFDASAEDSAKKLKGGGGG